MALNSSDKATSLTISVGREDVPDGITFRNILDPAQPVFTVQSGSLVLDQIYPYWGRILVAGA